MNTHVIFMMVTVFLITAVEAIEMTTIVIGVGLTRGWFATLLGGGVGMILLGGAVFGFGLLLAQIPLNVLRALIGILLLLFGVQWLRKSIYRISKSGFWSGEEEEEEEEEDDEQESQGPIEGLDWMAFARGFQGVFFEGLEIAFVVVTFGSGANSIGLAGVAAGVAFVIVVGVAIAARNLLTQIPGNTLKFAVGILLCTYGSYWSAVGMGAHWPGGDIGVLAVLGFYTLYAFGSVFAVRRLRGATEG
jgi:uncharacterized membrane protein